MATYRVAKAPLCTILQTPKPTWADCCQLLPTLFNTEECQRVTQAALKWLEEHVLAGTLNVQAYAQHQFPKEDPQWDPNEDRGLQMFEL